MPLSPGAERRARTREFIISRWELDHHWKQAQVQGLFLDCGFTRETFMKTVREHIDARTENKKPEAGAVNWE